MKIRRIIGWLCVLSVVLCPAVAADGGTVIYDDENGESLRDLLNEDDAVYYRPGMKINEDWDK